MVYLKIDMTWMMSKTDDIDMIKLQPQKDILWHQMYDHSFTIQVDIHNKYVIFSTQN
jgi:hypothetical protein